MLRKFLKFRYTAIRRFGERKWTAKDGVIEFNPIYTVNISLYEKSELSSDTDTAYIVELSNGTKFLTFMRGVFGRAQCEVLLSADGEEYNIQADQQANFQRTKSMIHKLNN